MTQPKFAAQDKNGRRYYKDPITLKRVPSVTTIIGVLSKPLLVPWAAKVSAEYAVDNWPELSRLPYEQRVNAIKAAHRIKRDDAANLGDSIHIYAEAYLKGEPTPPITDENESAIGALLGFFDMFRPELLGAEISVWSERGYAGTFDLLAKIAGETWLLDYKTGKGIYPEVGLQLSALGHGDRILNDELDVMPTIDRYGVIHVRPDHEVDGEPVAAFATLYEVHHIEESYAAFLAALDLYTWQKTSKEVIGDAVTYANQAE